jgi:hypothetical protein
MKSLLRIPLNYSCFFVLSYFALEWLMISFIKWEILITIYHWGKIFLLTYGKFLICLKFNSNHCLNFEYDLNNFSLLFLLFIFTSTLWLFFYIQKHLFMYFLTHIASLTLTFPKTSRYFNASNTFWVNFNSV